MTYMPTLVTNFGSSPFDTDHEINDQQEGMVEYELTSQPGINRPPSPDNSQNSGGTPAEQPAVTDKEPQIIDKTITGNENQEPLPEI